MDHGHNACVPNDESPFRSYFVNTCTSAVAGGVHQFRVLAQNATVIHLMFRRRGVHGSRSTPIVRRYIGPTDRTLWRLYSFTEYPVLRTFLITVRTFIRSYAPGLWTIEADLILANKQ